MNLLIKNAIVTDPAQNISGQRLDISVKNGVIAKLAEGVSLPDNCEVIDAAGCWTVPGLIDIHTHLRDPGFEYKEDIETGANAAAAGGFTGILAMPNTAPPMDNADIVSYVLRKASEKAAVNIYPAGCITKAMQGGELTDIEVLIKAGAIAVSEDGMSVTNTRLMTDALFLCKKYNIPMLSHCEDPYLAGGEYSDIGEALYIARDIMLAEYTGARVHICHVSTEKGIEIIREAKKRGVPVTAEAAPHHFILTKDDIPDNNANYKMNPPLRSESDKNAVIAGLKDGTIDCIATDHAPHADYEKQDYKTAANGIIGLETSLPLCITYLVNPGVLTPTELIKKMSYNPARILNIGGGTLKPGSKADITIIDPAREYVINPGEFRSKSRNTPFAGYKVTGGAVYTIKNGKVIYKAIT